MKIHQISGFSAARSHSSRNFPLFPVRYGKQGGTTSGRFGTCSHRARQVAPALRAPSYPSFPSAPCLPNLTWKARDE